MSGVSRDVRKRYGCSTRGLTLPSPEGKPECWVGRTKERYDENHYRCPGSLQRLGLSRCDSERRVHGGWREERDEYWVLEGRGLVFPEMTGDWTDRPCTFAVTRMQAGSGVCI